MAGLKKTSGAILLGLFCGAMLASSMPALADSTVINGPGFKIEKKHGWFGRKSTVYHDALGNEVETKTGFFGRKTTSTKLFGSQAVKSGNNVTVRGPHGEPLVSSKHTLFGGKQTQVDGNGIWHAVKNVFNQPATTTQQSNP